MINMKEYVSSIIKYIKNTYLKYKKNIKIKFNKYKNKIITKRNLIKLFINFYLNKIEPKKEFKYLNLFTVLKRFLNTFFESAIYGFMINFTLFFLLGFKFNLGTMFSYGIIMYFVKVELVNFINRIKTKPRGWLNGEHFRYFRIQ